MSPIPQEQCSPFPVDAHEAAETGRTLSEQSEQQQEPRRRKRKKDHSEQERHRLDEEIRKRRERAESARRHVEERFGDDVVVTIREFAALLGINHITLRKMIWAGEGPPVVKINERHLGIIMRAGRAWIEGRTVEPKMK